MNGVLLSRLMLHFKLAVCHDLLTWVFAVRYPTVVVSLVPGIPPFIYVHTLADTNSNTIRLLHNLKMSMKLTEVRTS